VAGFPLRRQWNIFHLRRRRLPSAVKAFVDFLRGDEWRELGRPLRRRAPSD
jgi:hypothetical protein